jgi:hypothetical protein
MLNPRQKRFAELYHLSGNATQSYVTVYGCTEESARRLGSLLLTNVDVQGAIQKLEQGAELLCELTKEEMLSDLAQILKAKPSDADHDNPLCELVMTKAGPAALFPSKIQAMTLMARLCGWEKPQEIKVGADDALTKLLGEIREKR